MYADTNGNKGALDGAAFKGRGVLQTTGYDGYSAYFGNVEHATDLSRPTLRGRAPELEEMPDAVRAGAYFWVTKECGERAKLDDVLGVSIRVNGWNRPSYVPNNYRPRVEALACASASAAAGAGAGCRDAAGVSQEGMAVGGVRLRSAPGIQPFEFRPRRQGGGASGAVRVLPRGGEYTAISPGGRFRVGHDAGRRAFVVVAPGGAPQLLTPVNGFDEARPVAVTDAGLVAGTASLPDPAAPTYRPGVGTRAVVWERAGQPHLLPLAVAGCRE